MMIKWKCIISLMGAVLLSVLLTAGCMTERDPVDMTNDNALDKRLFEGEWFYKQTITDIPYTVDYAFIGETNDLSMIRWEITENWLLAWSIHDKIEITDTEGDHVPARTPILAYPILDHFDIRLAESGTTGEDLPMRIEWRDNPWWQRRYFVIDPSSNSITDFNLKYINWTKIFEDPFVAEPVAGYKQLEFHDRNDKAINPKAYKDRYNAGGSHLADTFSFFSELIVSPTNWINWNNIYSWEDLENSISFESSRIEMRHYFWKVHRDELDENGFKAMEYQDNLFRRFGYFFREYRGVDPNYGYRESQVHYWANYYNISGDNQIVYYLSPNFPEKMVLTACGIAADYNHAFSKAFYEGAKARQSYTENRSGFVSDFPEQVKLADGLMQSADAGASPSSEFLPDATTPWPDDLKLNKRQPGFSSALPADRYKYKNYYYLDYNIESLKPKADWASSTDDTFLGRQGNMVAEMKRYCFENDETDKFVLKRNEFMPYSSIREGHGPKGEQNSISPSEIRAKYGEDINSRVARNVNYAVACELTMEHKCKRDEDGHKIARWKYELGDGQRSFIYWVDTPTEYGILGVAQWSDNPETGQNFSGVGHIAGSVLQWSVSRELDRYFMIEALQEQGFDPTRDRYEKMINDLIVDPVYARIPEVGEEDDRPYLKSNLPSRAPTMPKPGTDAYEISTLFNPRYLQEVEKHESLDRNDLEVIHKGKYAEEDYMRLQRLSEKTLPQLRNNADIEQIRGTKWEALMTPNGLLSYVYPDHTSYTEDMLYGISPLYWGTQQGLDKKVQKEIELSKECYFQSEWLDGGFLEIIKKFDDAGYSRNDIRLAVERIMFKGVAEHEVGHALGLRHNFMGSADELNYVGTDGTNGTEITGYWKFKSDFQSKLNQKISDFRRDNHRAPTPIEKFYLSKQVDTPRDWYMYSSVMDYMDEFYFNGFGLGRYDISALSYVYGKVVEKYQLDESNNVVLGPAPYKRPVIEYQPLTEYRKCDKYDIYHSECSCLPGDDDNCVCRDHAGMAYCYNKENYVWALRKESPVKLVTNEETGVIHALPTGDAEKVDIQLNGDIKPYLYGPDRWYWEEPMCNVWDKGYTARDIVRNMADQYKRFYFWRFFRRGNPRFSRLEWDSIAYRHFFPFAHFALDFNYNRSKLPEWQEMILDNSSELFDEEKRPLDVSLAKKEYLLALNGVEEWEEKIGEKMVTKDLTPGGPGDYLIAAMEAFNFLVYDIVYSPNVGKHVLRGWVDNPEVQFFERNPYIYGDDELEDIGVGSIVDVDMRYGHYHKNHWDRQEDLGINMPKMDRRGFTIAKDAAMYILANSGWWVQKYRYENMANSFSYVSDGFENALFHLMSDVVNEDSLFTFSRYCATSVETGKYDISVFQPHVNTLFLWNWTDNDIASDSSWKPEPSNINKNMCQRMSEVEQDIRPPIFASWIYFDKMTPAFWVMWNQANTMADNTPYRYYYAAVIEASDRINWPPVDENEIECLNSTETHFFRARKTTDDDRPSPIYNLVKRCHDLQNLCVYNKNYSDVEHYGEVADGQIPGNFLHQDDTCEGGYPRWYMNRTIENMESTVLMLNEYIKFWIGIVPYFNLW